MQFLLAQMGCALRRDSAGYARAIAMAGVGLGTQLKTPRGLGTKPSCVDVFASLVVGVASTLAAFLLGTYVHF